MAALIEPSITGKLASTFRAKLFKINWLEDLHHCVDVPRAAKAERFANRIPRLKHTNDLCPHAHFRVGFGVADEIHAVLSTTK